MTIPLQIPASFPRRAAAAGLSALPLTITAALLPRLVSLVRAGRSIKSSDRPSCDPRAPLAEGTRWFEAGETGVTYRAVLGDYLQGEDRITIVDPHVKSFRQIRLLGELLENLAHSDGTEVHVHLVTGRPSHGLGWEIGQAKALITVKEAAATSRSA